MLKRNELLKYWLPLLLLQSGGSPVLKILQDDVFGRNAAMAPIRALGTATTKPIYMRSTRSGRLAMACLSMAMLAAALPAKAQTSTVCGNAPAQKGWVTTSFGPQCDSTGARSRTVQKIDGMPAGTVVTICDNDMPPPGWATLSWGDSTARIGQRAIYKRTVENLNGLPAGTTVTVCGYDLLPAGWAVDSMGGPCATVKGLSFRTMTVRKL